MSSYGSCKGCGASISYVSIPVCFDCIQKYKPIVQEYIQSNPGASAGEVARETGTPIDIVHYFSSPKHRDDVKLINNLARAFTDTKDAERVVGMKGCYHLLTKEYREAHKQRY